MLEGARLVSWEIYFTRQARTDAKKIAAALDVVGLINVQYAVKDEQVFVLEANPNPNIAREEDFAASAKAASGGVIGSPGR